MDEQAIYMVNNASDGAVGFTAPDAVIPGLLAILWDNGFHIATRTEYRQAIRNAELVDAGTAEEGGEPDDTTDDTARGLTWADQEEPVPSWIKWAEGWEGER